MFRKKRKLSMKAILNRNKMKSTPVLVQNDQVKALSQGNRGESVEHLQKMLVDLVEIYPAMPVLEIDGKFGQNTRLAVSTFQKATGLSQTGVVDNVTWNMIYKMHHKCDKKVDRQDSTDDYFNQSNNIIREGSKGRYVVQLQEYLNKISETKTTIPKLEIDGSFGSKTKTSVVEFQRLFNLKQDGIVGDDTWKKLYKEATGQDLEVDD